MVFGSWTTSIAARSTGRSDSTQPSTACCRCRPHASHHGLVHSETGSSTCTTTDGSSGTRSTDSWIRTHAPVRLFPARVMIPMEIISDGVELPMALGWALVHPDPSVPIWSPDEQDFLTITGPRPCYAICWGRAPWGKVTPSLPESPANTSLRSTDSGTPQSRGSSTPSATIGRASSHPTSGPVTISGQEVATTTVADMDPTRVSGRRPQFDRWAGRTGLSRHQLGLRRQGRTASPAGVPSRRC